MKRLLPFTLTAFYILGLVLSVIAASNEEFTKAIYNMMWTGLFLYFSEKGEATT
jgi:hypothetical protein